MRISKEKAAENREKVVAAAAKLFRERGLEGVGVDALAEAAGLTHGAVYSHFKSKDELAAEAVRQALHQSMSEWLALTEGLGRRGSLRKTAEGLRLALPSRCIRRPAARSQRSAAMRRAAPTSCARSFVTASRQFIDILTSVSDGATAGGPATHGDRARRGDDRRRGDGARGRERSQPVGRDSEIGADGAFVAPLKR